MARRRPEDQAVTNSNIMIVGAGMGGLTAALALQRAGFKVAIYEQAPALREVGAGLSISPNSMHGLDYVGVGDRVRELGSLMDGSTVRHYRTNEIVTGSSIGTSKEQTERFGNQYMQIHRADVHTILTEAARANDPDCIKLDCEFVDFEQNDGRVTVKFKNGSEASADVMIGCDGGKSLIRERGFSEEPPKFAGYVAYRGLVPVKDLDPSVVRTGATLSIGPDQMFMRYTVRNRSLMNFVGMVTTSEWKEEGWNIQSDVSEVLHHFDEWHDEVKSIIRATPPGAGFKWALVHRSPLPSWTNGRVVLLGDAAHTITPFLGQGATMAIEDGVVMGRCFEAANNFDDALTLFEQARVERGNWVLVESQKQADRYMKSDPENFDLTGSRKVHGQVYMYNPATAPLIAAAQ